MLPNSFYKASLTVSQKQTKNKELQTKKFQNAKLIPVMNFDTKILINILASKIQQYIETFKHHNKWDLFHMCKTHLTFQNHTMKYYSVIKEASN